MAVQPGQVSKLTSNEMTQLVNWNFIASYQTYHVDLVDLAKGTYTAVCGVLQAPPTKKQFYKLYRETLLWSGLYRKKIAGRKSHLPTSLYEYYAHLLAKHILEQDWNVISSVRCP